MNTAKDNPAPIIFDRALLRARRRRAGRLTGDRFVDARVCEDMSARLADVSRDFANVLILGRAHLANDIAHASAAKFGDVICAGSNIDDEVLPYKDAQFDLVISALNLHSVNHVPRALMELRRVLKPDGLFLGALFGGQNLHGLRHALYEAETNIYGRVSPRISPMIELGQAGTLLGHAGFAMPVIDRDFFVVNYGKLESLYQDLRLMGETNALDGRHKAPVSRRFFAELGRIYARDHSTDNGRQAVSFDILWLTGWAPHPGQQKPQKPGSAKTRLSDALGVKEYKA